jgi:membrane protein YqaA with SNARE-associated domain
VRPLFGPLLGYFLSPAGLVLLGALDSSLIFFLPLGIDVALILVAARHPESFWAHAVAATSGSLIGAAGTYLLGRKIGQEGLGRWIGKASLARAQERVSEKAAPAVAVLALIPPPFPFTALVLASGAWALDPWRFFTTLAIVRVIRFGVEAGLAARYGRQILVWMDSIAFEVTVGVLIVSAVIGTVVSAAAAIRASGRTSR